MTRNLYLGADLAPAIAATSLGEFTEANGQILRDVTPTTSRPGPRAWRRRSSRRSRTWSACRRSRSGAPARRASNRSSTRPPRRPRPRSATTTSAAARPAQQGQRQAAVPGRRLPGRVRLRSPADENGVPGDGPNSLIPNAEINGRLTMRDVILVRNGAGVTLQERRRAAHFANLLIVTISGVEIPVTRGWTAIDAKVARQQARSASSTPTSRRSTPPPRCRASAPAGGRAGRSRRAG